MGSAKEEEDAITSLAEQLAVTTEQLDVAVDRAQSWKNIAEKNNDAAAKLATEVEKLAVREQKLRAACAKAEMSIMETSGEWHLFDTSERGKQLDAQSLEIANKNLDLELEIEKLRRLLNIAEAKLKTSLANNLCSDHRDKQAGKTCLACEVARLRAELDRLKDETQSDDEGTEYCCECGADYPRVELVRDGEVYCRECRGKQ